MRLLRRGDTPAHRYNGAMRPKPPPDYLAGYPPALVAQVNALIAQDQLGTVLLQRYPVAHTVRTDKALYDYVVALKHTHLRTAPPLSKVAFDSKLQVIAHALGTHTAISRVHGGKLKAKREIRVATVFRDMPPEFLRMIVVHELAHLRVRNHDKAFYQLCCHMEPAYPQYELDLRAYLCLLGAGGAPLWAAQPGSVD